MNFETIALFEFAFIWICVFYIWYQAFKITKLEGD